MPKYIFFPIIFCIRTHSWLKILRKRYFCWNYFKSVFERFFLSAILYTRHGSAIMYERNNVFTKKINLYRYSKNDWNFVSGFAMCYDQEQSIGDFHQSHSNMLTPRKIHTVFYKKCVDALGRGVQEGRSEIITRQRVHLVRSSITFFSKLWCTFSNRTLNLKCFPAREWVSAGDPGSPRVDPTTHFFK